MSTISNERLESLQRQFKEEGFNDISNSEIMQLVEENLALRKEREKTGTVVNDERYQQLSESYHAQEKRLFKIAQRIKGPSFDKYAYSPSQAIDVLEASVFSEICRAAMLNQSQEVAETNTTSQQFESLAGKSVGGWIPCSERMPPEKTGALVATEFDGPGDWRMKWGTRVPGHPDAKNGWLIPGASWAPSHWQLLPDPPCK
ncbi:DUF551 domain-containing protein [Cronobacter sakazakii]|nr:DUF551 domain-containing protein [Cronobacter sakazakii]